MTPALRLSTRLPGYSPVRASCSRMRAADTAAATAGREARGCLMAVSTLRLSTRGRRISAARASFSPATATKPWRRISCRAKAEAAPSRGQYRP